MNAEPFIWMITVMSLVTIATGYFFYKVLRTDDNQTGEDDLAGS